MKVYCDVLSDQLLESLKATRERTQRIFQLIHPDAYYVRPIPLRHPIVFYDGHLDAFIWNTLFSGILGEPPLQPEFDSLFARGIDPEDIKSARKQEHSNWPSRNAVQDYKDKVTSRLYEYVATTDFSRSTHPLLQNGHIIHLLIEHELMHQETLLYMIHQLPHHLKCKPEGADLPLLTAKNNCDWDETVRIPGGIAILGAQEGEFAFTWDNERPTYETLVPAFEVDKYNVTNRAFLTFVQAGGYENREFWDDQTWAWRSHYNLRYPFYWRKQGEQWKLRALFEDIPLPLDWPVYVTHAEACAYARFVGKRLPTEAEWHRAAVGDNYHDPYPWGNELPTALHGNFDFSRWLPVSVGQYPKGASPFGVHDLLGNGWEWTASVFSPFTGFEPSTGYPRYSADFFEGQHYVMKGGSPFTAAQLLRRSFRNWFYWNYPYMYATFRCVSS